MRKSIWLAIGALLFAASIIVVISDANSFTPEITEESTYSKINDLEGVSMSTSEKTYSKHTKSVLIILQNNIDREYTYGEGFTLEKLENGQWYQLSQSPSVYERAWIAIGYTLKSNSEVKKLENLEWVYDNNFKSGTYRIIKDVIDPSQPVEEHQHFLAAEFNIK